MHSIHALLEVAMQGKASDLVLKAGAPPIFRVDGRMHVSDLPPLSVTETRELAYEILFSAGRDTLLLEEEKDISLSDDPNDLMEELYRLREMDLVFTIPGIARVRANLFLQRGCVGAALRIIPLHPLTVEELGLPLILKRMALEPQGLIIITGPTGSGKTTTMAALIEEINRSKCAHVFTIEDPIEYVFSDRKSVIHQREIGRDTASFQAALRSVMRQTPDVIAIGELRDAETMEVAMVAAEIGHLVITTLHTTSAATTIDRIVNSFPQHLKQQTCQQLASSLLCVTSQRLVRRARGGGRVPAVEIMTNAPRVRKALEEGDTTSLYACIREGSHFGMNTLNQALERMVHGQIISVEEALQTTSNPTELKQMLRQQ